MFVSVLGSDEQWRRSLQGLASARGFIRDWLREHLDLRVTPDLDFRPDRSMEHAAAHPGALRQLASERPDVTRANDLRQVLAPFRWALRRRALMLGHVHPDADVLGTLLALGLALEARGWQVAYGGPHPAPAALAFLPGVDRYACWTGDRRPRSTCVLTDCPNPTAPRGCWTRRGPRAPRCVNIDHHPDNRRYGDVNWIDPAAAATGEMVYGLLAASGCHLARRSATNLFTAIHTDTGSFRYSNVTAETFASRPALVGGRRRSGRGVRPRSTSGRGARVAALAGRGAAPRAR